MATSIIITITETRALSVEGRLVAGETAEVSIGGATPTALYLVAPDQTVAAACEAFTPTGQGSGGTGFLQLATEQVAALFAHTPAGRMVAVWALVNDANGVAGAGWIPVVSAPMPDELIDIDIDFYLRASQVGAGLAIVDGTLVCTISPAPVQSVNGKTGAVVLAASDVGAAPAADLRYALDDTWREPDPETGEVQLDDRTVNMVYADGLTEMTLVFPPPQDNGARARDFLVMLVVDSAESGNVTLHLNIDDWSGDVYTPGGVVPDVPLNRENLLYFTEYSPGPARFLFKVETVDFASMPIPTGGE